MLNDPYTSMTLIEDIDGQPAGMRCMMFDAF
jgi:hypothetical protein